MNSEGLLGPVSYPWTVRVETGPYRITVERYFNILTRESTPEDPRLGSLSAEWELVDIVDPVDRLPLTPKFKSTATGQVLDYDPRLIPEALQVRGVDLKTFRLE